MNKLRTGVVGELLRSRPPPLGVFLEFDGFVRLRIATLACRRIVGRKNEALFRSLRQKNEFLLILIYLLVFFVILFVPKRHIIQKWIF